MLYISHRRIRADIFNPIMISYTYNALSNVSSTSYSICDASSSRVLFIICVSVHNKREIDIVIKFGNKTEKKIIHVDNSSGISIRIKDKIEIKTGKNTYYIDFIDIYKESVLFDIYINSDNINMFHNNFINIVYDNSYNVRSNFDSVKSRIIKCIDCGESFNKSISIKSLLNNKDINLLDFTIDVLLCDYSVCASFHVLSRYNMTSICNERNLFRYNECIDEISIVLNDSSSMIKFDDKYCDRIDNNNNVVLLNMNSNLYISVKSPNEYDINDICDNIKVDII